jgi:hypothetical protein
VSFTEVLSEKISNIPKIIVYMNEPKIAPRKGTLRK